MKNLGYLLIIVASLGVTAFTLLSRSNNEQAQEATATGLFSQQPPSTQRQKFT